jgi:hypothetical protein
MTPTVVQRSALISPAIKFSEEITYVIGVGSDVIMQILQSAVKGKADFSLNQWRLVVFLHSWLRNKNKIRNREIRLMHKEVTTLQP